MIVRDYEKEVGDLEEKILHLEKKIKRLISYFELKWDEGRLRNYQIYFDGLKADYELGMRVQLQQIMAILEEE